MCRHQIRQLFQFLFRDWQFVVVALWKIQGSSVRVSTFSTKKAQGIPVVSITVKRLAVLELFPRNFFQGIPNSLHFYPIYRFFVFIFCRIDRRAFVKKELRTFIIPSLHFKDFRDFFPWNQLNCCSPVSGRVGSRCCLKAKTNR